MAKVSPIETRNKAVTPSEERPASARALGPFEEMERMLDQIRGQLGFGTWPWRLERPHWPDLAAPFGGAFPRVELVEKDDALVLRADIPGVRKEDLEVSLTDDAVTISGHTASEKEGEGELRYHETYRGEFTRTIRLPAAVDGDQVKASYRDGVLELEMPKVEKARRRTIQVQ